ncbi:MAG TPA: PilN domain-containing protein [Malonomonas sp.]
MKVTLNLASRRYVNRRALNRLGILLLMLLLVLLTFQVRGFLLRQNQVQNYEKNLVEMQQEYQQLLGKTVQSLSPEQLARQQVEFNQAQTLLQRDAFRWTQLFDRLEKLLPAGVSIASFTPDYKSRSLELSGSARTLADLQRLLNNLHNDSFAQVFLNSQTQIKVSDGQGGEVSALGFNVTLEGVF